MHYIGLCTQKKCWAYDPVSLHPACAQNKCLISNTEELCLGCNIESLLYFTLLRACSPDVPGRSVFVTSYAIGWFCGLSHSCVMASILFSFCAVSFSVVRLSENMSFMGIFDCWSLCMVGHISSMCFCDSSGWPHPLHF